MRPSREISEMDFAKFPISYSHPESLQRFLQMRQLSVLDGLLAINEVRSLINERIVAQLGCLPRLEATNARLFLKMSSFSTAELNLLSARVTVCFHAEIIRNITNPNEINKLLEWARYKEVSHLLLGSSLEPFVHIPICPHAEIEFLTPVSSVLKPYLLGLLPHAYMQRMALILPADADKTARPLRDTSATEALKCAVELAVRLPVAETTEQRRNVT